MEPVSSELVSAKQFPDSPLLSGKIDCFRDATNRIGWKYRAIAELCAQIRYILEQGKTYQEQGTGERDVSDQGNAATLGSETRQLQTYDGQ
ncbi:hypothetical protein [Aminobacter sp. MSH1]|uniref:hypothetical protein n=1 Tax=Aminobacter sp. MSH1 TaxID=374606 RepID=UPI00131EE8FF|nr:hypothetical protein [Aminobacter sp. MSH1]